MDSYTVGDPIFLIFAASMQFMHICLQFTHFFCGARNVAIYAFCEPKKLNLGLRAKKTEFPALGLELRQRQLSLHQSLVFPCMKRKYHDCS